MREDPDPAVAAPSQVLEGSFAIRGKRGDDEAAAALEREHPAPQLGRERVARLVDDGERHVAQVAIQRVSEDDEVEDRKEHRGDDQDRLSPQRQVGALADGNDPEKREARPARNAANALRRDVRRAPGRLHRPAQFSPRSARPV